MITHRSYGVEPWALSEQGLHLDVLPQSESVFALANGHVGWRGNLDEGEPHGLPGTYLNGVHELHPLPYAEAGYGYPESGQTVIDVTNGKLLRLLVDDEPFDLRYGRLRSHERVLDLRAGVLRRSCEWTSPAGTTVRVRSTRLVSFTQRAIAAVAYEVEAVDGEARVVVQSELVANEQLPRHEGDPRAAVALEAPLEAEEHFADGTRLRLVHRTRRSGLRVAAAADHVVTAPGQITTGAESRDDVARLTATTVLAPGERLRVEKTVAHGWSSTRSLPAVGDQVDAALSAAAYGGWQGLVDEQRSYLDDFWARADVEVDGDEEIQQAVRFALFHVLQAGARAEQRAIPAKGLTGSGYDGHAFWDTETFVLPLLTHTAPGAVTEALRWRQNTLPAARDRAAQLGLKGAAFPWRTIDGSERSAYWPAGTAAFHVNAAIADAVVRHTAVTGDTAFERDTGVELLVETARLWRSLGHHDHHGAFHIDGVTGPDEYSAVVDDNTYTNLMARRNLLAAVDAVERHPDRARQLGVDEEESAAWRDAAQAMYVPYDDELGVHEQHAGFTRHQRWDFENTGPDQYPLMLHFPYFDLYRKQVVKQADLVLAMYKCGDRFDDDQMARDFAYYEPLTVRDSSLSACCQAVIAAQVGHLGLAYDYLAESALMDLADLEHNTRDGLHIAALAGTWTALVAGFGGMRQHGTTVGFAPRLPERLSRLAFNVGLLDTCLRVEIKPRHATYTLLSGDTLTVRHHGEPVTLDGDKPRRLDIPAPTSPGPAPDQPPHRRPGRRRGRAG
ncbi:glycoside hydrolase family 65 protein [Streptomyces caniscabiei]|uniref:Glycoside hydrolase family 65 protein n=1 Tax=Streptomyces caniscabiei TaxID=2746961 RepID=A0ABU4MMU8_9ACTN|nr:glycoside hydrolase family 65 protein [Streptomyces caniscabiei]MBE4733792.1 glycoside hydrolase family 65 protein [Streptomyces caniscabiei]MBE4754969.1 glycoside hydrolase family 65 protein [Streptomyces caniscabiei]MBE4768211.1 glycoside hydrolase family 65 protein [Streptomyces caniscabiei]MBE4782287.1 glycoside hydrolase family 65 protein [Streptomyces caniscabiei]MBE4793575.1 glycoside hydrolase family 65 protein [Streptomyces caniscabiei]